MNHDFHPVGNRKDRPINTLHYHSGAYFAPEYTASEVGAFSTLALAHLGDGVFELMMRTALAQAGVTSAAMLHKETVRRVNAPAQAKAAEHVMPALSDEELAVYKRGRNAKVNGIPQKADVSEYHAATGLETLFGWLWLQGRTERLVQIFQLVAEVL